MPPLGPAARINANPEGLPQRCAVPGCGQPTMMATGRGLAALHCTRHVRHLARHGSHWAPSIKAPELRPYLLAASGWISDHGADADVRLALMGLGVLMDTAGPVEPAQNIKRWPAARRARVAFARLREAGVPPERLLATHIAVAAIIEDDLGSHRVIEYRVVQVAKAVHRLASGTHKRWDFPMPDGTTAPIGMHVYPRSSGIVLRVIGGQIEELCRDVRERVVDAVRSFKTERYGPHPSRLPRWLPPWRRQVAARPG